MQTMKTYLIALYLAGFLPGCTNALYFYETEKISLTAEVRPDSSQPVQGSLGIKQRVVLIAPKKSDTSKNNNNSNTPKILDNCPIPKNKDNNEGQKQIDNDDAVSAISSFSFKIIPKVDAILNPVLIQTAFITGDAAACLTDIQAQNAAQAIAIEGVQPSGANISIMSNVVSELRNSVIKEDKAQLSLLDDLGKAVTPTNYPVSIFELEDITTPKPFNIIIKEGTPVNYSNIDSAILYWGKLNGSATVLEGVFAVPDQYKFGDISANNEMVLLGLQNQYDKTMKELKRISQELAGNSIYINTLQYYIDNYIKQSR